MQSDSVKFTIPDCEPIVFKLSHQEMLKLMKHVVETYPAQIISKEQKQNDVA